MSNKMALDALTDMLNGWRYIRSFHGDLYGVGWDRAEAKAVAAIAALQAEPQPEPVAQIVGTGGTANMPLLQWLSADHSFRAPIGSMLYALPSTPPKD